MIVRVPASSANLGPGFDTLGHGLVAATSMPASSTASRRPARNASISSILPVSPSGAPAARATCGCARRFLSVVAWASAAPCGSPASSSPTPSYTAATQRCWPSRAPAMLALATELEGHADNVAASLFGGIVATADGDGRADPVGVRPGGRRVDPVVHHLHRRVAAKLGRDGADRVTPCSTSVALRCWSRRWPPATSMRCAAPRRTAFTRIGGWPRPHRRRRRLQAALGAGAWCSWLSGSGPTVAAMCPLDDADDLAAQHAA